MQGKSLAQLGPNGRMPLCREMHSGTSTFGDQACWNGNFASAALPTCQRAHSLQGPCSACDYVRSKQERPHHRRQHRRALPTQAIRRDNSCVATARTRQVACAVPGIGYETALALAGLGYATVLACRDMDKARAARDRIKCVACAVNSMPLLPAPGPTLSTAWGCLLWSRALVALFHCMGRQPAGQLLTRTSPKLVTQGALSLASRPPRGPSTTRTVSLGALLRGQCS